MQPELDVVGHSNSSDVEQALTPVSPRWNLGTKIAFRFAFIYFSLYNIYIPLHLLAFPPFSWIYVLYNRTSNVAVHWVSRQVLHLSHDFSRDYLNTAAGSKDMTFDYVQALCIFAVAVLATVIWSLLDRRRPNYAWLYNWFILYMRLALAATIIPYGAIKIFPYQFPPPTLSKLFGTYGNSSPADLMWTFMGASRSYSAFGGVLELVSGVLLVVPRLATLGALVTAGVMTNVLMLNLGYDFFVKLISIHLLLMAIIILLPDALRLLDFFVLHRSVRLVPPRPLAQRIWLNRTFVVLQIAFGVLLLGYNLYRSHQIVSQRDAGKNTPLYGIWAVDDFTVAAQARPPLVTDPLRWQRFIVESTEGAAVQGMTGSMEYLYFHPNSPRNGFSLTRYGDPSWLAEFTYDKSNPGGLFLSGKMDGVPITIKLHREDEAKFLLKPGFRWIQDPQ